MGIFAELKRRNVFRVGIAYLVLAWVVIQVTDVAVPALRLPEWVPSLVFFLGLIGFPFALFFAWAFELTPEGVKLEKDVDRSESVAHATGRKLDVFIIGLLVVAVAFLLVDNYVLDGEQRDGKPELEQASSGDSARSNESKGVVPIASNTANAVPVVVLMDTFAPRGVYDQQTRDSSGTNADVLSDVLRDLPVVTQKEAIGSTWDREDQLLKHHPDLVLIHRSGFFHSMNLELGFGYSDDPSTFDEKRWVQLYELADNKLAAAIGFVGKGRPTTQFLVYSRGTGGGWQDPDYRAAWVKKLVGRFPSLKGRVTTMAVPGGVESASFREPATAQLVKQQVQSLLGIETQE